MYLQLFLMGKREGGREERRMKGEKIKLDALPRGQRLALALASVSLVPGVLLSPAFSQSHLIEVLNPRVVLLAESAEHSFLLVIH